MRDVTLDSQLTISSMPKVMMVGEYTWPWYQKACADALESLGCDVVRFGWSDVFYKWESDRTEPSFRSAWHRLQYRFRCGPIIWRMADLLFETAVREKPDVMFFYNVALFRPRKIRALRRALPKTIFCQYSNDNPFSPDANWLLWNNFINSIPCFDLHYAFRRSNFEEFRKRGARHVELLRAYFIPEDEFPVPEGEIPGRYRCDVVFAGHYENDGRVAFLEAVCRAGYKLNLFGGGWEGARKGLDQDSPLHAKYPVVPVTGAEYRFALCGAKVALCFLSSLNRDTYTRRNFQIPAMKVAMLSQYTDDLVALFAPDVEAVFFRSSDQMLEKLRALLANESNRRAIAEAGYSKVYYAGHDVISRMKCFLKDVHVFSSARNK